MKLQIDRKHSFQAMLPTFSSHMCCSISEYMKVQVSVSPLIRWKIPALTMDDVQRCTWYMITNKNTFLDAFADKTYFHLCTSSYCSFSLVARASTDRSLSVVKRTPACPLHEEEVKRVNQTHPVPRARQTELILGLGGGLQSQVRNTRRTCNFSAGVPVNGGSRRLPRLRWVLSYKHHTRLSRTFWTERVSAALHLPTNA